MLNRRLDELATTKATLGATQETALLLLDRLEAHGYTHFWLVYTPLPRRNTSPMMVTMMMMLVMVVHATTMILANSNVHLEGGQRQPPKSA